MLNLFCCFKIERKSGKMSRYTGKWKAPEIKFLEKNWKKLSLSEIAQEVNKTEEEVSKKACSLYLNQGKIWSELELNFLEKQWGKINKLTICKRLGRTKSAIEKKATHLNLGPCTEANLELMTVYKASQILGIDRRKILSWNKKHELKIHSINLLGHKKTNMVNIEEFFEWLESHQELWDASKIERYGFGIEPEWLKNKIKQDTLS